MHGSDNTFLVLQFLLTLPSTRRKSAGSQFTNSCPASDALCLYKSADSKCLSLM